MSDTFQFWTHGVNVIPEYSKELTGDFNGLYLRRAGNGAIVRQNRGTSNWFHFPIPSATRLDDDAVDRRHAWLRVKVNTHAVIDIVHVREATGPETQCPVIYNSGNISITGQDTQMDFDLPDAQCRGPLVICVHAVFEEEGGEITFTAAGGWFEEHT